MWNVSSTAPDLRAGTYSLTDHWMLTYPEGLPS